MIIEGLLTLEQLKIIEENLKVCGEYICFRQAQEECSELAVAISHACRLDKADHEELLEEFADLSICMTQVLMRIYESGIPKERVLSYIDKGINKTKFKTNRRKEENANPKSE